MACRHEVRPRRTAERAAAGAPRMGAVAGELMRLQGNRAGWMKGSAGVPPALGNQRHANSSPIWHLILVFINGLRLPALKDRGTGRGPEGPDTARYGHVQ